MKYRKLFDSAAGSFLYVAIPLAVALVVDMIAWYIETALHWEAYLKEGYEKVIYGPIITALWGITPLLLPILLITVFPLITLLRVCRLDSKWVVTFIGGTFGVCFSYAIGDNFSQSFIGVVIGLISFRLAWLVTTKFDSFES